MSLLFGELDELSEAAALRHLHHCTRCRGLWGHLKATKELAQLPMEEPPSELFSSILSAERTAHRSLSLRERSSRAISVLAEYAMRPQLAMAALLVLMVGSSLVFVRSRPDPERDAMRVVEQGKPKLQVGSAPVDERHGAKVFAGDPSAHSRPTNDEKSEESGRPHTETNSAIEPPARTYSLALTAYQEGRYAEAERLFSEVALAGGSKAGPAALHEGHSARNGSGCQRAAPIYDRVADSFSGTVADEAAWHAATCYRSMGQLDRAAAHFRTLAKRPAYLERAQSALEEIAPAGSPPPAESGDSVAGSRPATTDATDAPSPASAAAPGAPAARGEATSGPPKAAKSKAGEEGPAPDGPAPSTPEEQPQKKEPNATQP